MANSNLSHCFKKNQRCLFVSQYNAILEPLPLPLSNHIIKEVYLKPLSEGKLVNHRENQNNLNSGENYFGLIYGMSKSIGLPTAHILNLHFRVACCSGCCCCAYSEAVRLIFWKEFLRFWVRWIVVKIDLECLKWGIAISTHPRPFASMHLETVGLAVSFGNLFYSKRHNMPK